MYQQHLQWRYILILEEFNKKWCLRQGALQRKVHINVHFVHISSFHPPTEERTECLWRQPLAILSLSRHLQRRRVTDVFPSHYIATEGRWHDVLGLALNILPVLIPVEIWFIPGGGEEDKVPDQIDTVETISAGVITSELTWHWHTSGQECVVCVQFCF